ncbi:MAG: tetratricopeptide repeat protein [Rhodocyclaceae bacterium]|nr:tetratricopeptide repeat protein [Rhodocyclaceae bacterium]
MSQSSLEQAVAWHQAGQLEAAESAYRGLLAANPRDAHAMHYLGMIELQRDRADAAATWIVQALTERPNEAAFLCSLGQVRRRQGRSDEAEAAYRQAVKRAPTLYQAWHNLAALYEALGDDRQAIECFERALKLAGEGYPGKGGLAAACRRQGFTLLDLGEPAAAATLFRRACELDGADAAAWGALASSETLAGRPLAAQPAFDRALALTPGDARLQNNRANALRDAGRLAEAMAGYEAAVARDPAYLDARSNLLFAALSAAPDANTLAAWQREHGAAFAVAPVERPARQPAAPPRIGIVSADLRAHPVAWFLLGWFTHRDRASAHVTAYHCGQREDAVTGQIREGCDAWVSCAEMDDTALAARIAEDGIDLLVDLAGHTADNRLGVFARRPALRQLTFLGYAGSTGLEAFDARIADHVTEPAGVPAWSSEPVIRLDGSYLCYTPPIEPPKPSPPPMRKNRYVTFGCATQLAKLTDATLALWSAALARVPRYRLVLRSMSLDDPLLRKDVMARLAGAGIDTARVKLEGPKPLAAHIKAWSKVDIALDTTPFNLATQSCDALWMGVPVVTLAGDRHAGRLGASLLHALDLDELVADSPEAFAAICAGLAADAPRLEALRARLRERMYRPGSVSDVAGFAARLDAAFDEVLSRPAGSRGASSR